MFRCYNERIAARREGHCTRRRWVDVVVLSDAWQKGAQQLDADTRVLFANDPLNLLGVGGPTNQATGDKDVVPWLPPNMGFRCEYVAIQIAVKAKYDL